ncbi:MAG: alpha/beta fold hydrolase [Cardiobacteriaceae bacterium]|nr:alpha/beta fold hydrolase [Cardiobacteriaceae bacterium]
MQYPTPLTFDATTQPSHAIIWLHGLGSSGDDFSDVIPLLNLRPSTRVILPNAPIMPVSINGGYPMPAWYDLYDLTFPRVREDLTGIAQSALWIEQLMREENERGIADSHILLVGFSQGGAVALHVGLRRLCAGVIALSTYLTDATNTPPALDKRPFVFMHGRVDTVVPISAGQSALQTLQSLGYQTKWHDYPMPHSLCPEQILDLKRFFHEQGF